MDFWHIVKKRRSIQKYKETPVDWDRIAHVLDAGRFAPSAGNLQNWKFIAVRDQATRDKLAVASDQEWMEEAPVHIVIIAQADSAVEHYGDRGHFYATQNCAAAAQNMLLAATAVGLGSCWVGSFDENQVKKALNMPTGNSPHVIITLGFPAEDPVMPPKKEIEHIAHMEKWAGKGQSWGAKGYHSVVIADKTTEFKEAVKKMTKNFTKK